MRFFITLSYNGARYHGWQVQPGCITVQSELNRALTTLLRTVTEVVGAGRTDAGVNASKMVAHFDYSVTPLSDDDLRQLHYRLNKFLPPDIAIKEIRAVDDDMHARFSAKSRMYHYYITTEKSPFEQFAYRYPQALDFGLMNEAAKVLFEYKDFTSFSKLHTDVKTNNCVIMEAHWDEIAENKWCFTIRADRFLRNMVRAIVGTLIDVGRGVLTIDDFRSVIEKKDRCTAGSSVPGNALFLADVTY